jgi:hypothetical protein
MPIELGFILQRFVAMAEEDESLRDKQPWKAAHEKTPGSAAPSTSTTPAMTRT